MNEYGLRRIDDRDRRGWHVAIGRYGQVYQKFFGDAGYGGKAKARRAAVEYRDHIDQTIARPSRADIAQVVRKNNTSGIPGVTRHGGDQGGNNQPYWTARWVPETGGPTKIRKFSVGVYGEEGAKARAVQVREEAMKLMEDQVYIIQKAKRLLPPRAPRPEQVRVECRVDIETDTFLWEIADKRCIRRSTLISEILNNYARDAIAGTQAIRKVPAKNAKPTKAANATNSKSLKARR